MLVQERDGWRRDFEAGERPDSAILADYRKHRNSEYWRASRAMEKLCEYILFLESNETSI